MIQRIETADDLQDVWEESFIGPLLIFKHSSRCPVSAHALSEMKSSGVSFHIIYVIENRPESNRLAEMTGLRHESPQVLLISNGKSIWSTSHYGIRGETIRDVLHNARPGESGTPKEAETQVR